MRKVVGSCLAVILSSVIFSQKQTLDYFVAANIETLAEGVPLVYLEGERITSTDRSLDGFDRKIVKYRKLRAIVPNSMVHIDDTFSQAPDLYDGLDLKTKVQYLLSTLSEEQIKVATSKGIGFGDLTKEQSSVFTSLLPKTIHVEKTEPDGNSTRVADSFHLNETQRHQVRLKFTRSTQLEMTLANRNAFTIVNSMDYLGTQFLSGYVRRTDEPNGSSGDIFGVKVRTLVPNQLKPTDLDYNSASLKKAITLPSAMPIIEVCRLIRDATNVSIIPDPRVAQRKVTVVGGEVQADELVKAIAQMVTGTYRRLGTDYVLTSDLMGLGTRKLRFYEWEEDILAKIWKSEGEWRSKIGKSNALDLAKSNINDPIQPNDAFNKYLVNNDILQGSNRVPIPDESMDGVIREFIQRRNAQYPEELVKEKGVVARSVLNFNFVLPTGQDMKEGDGNNQLGTFDNYRSVSSSPYLDPTKLIKKVQAESNISVSFRVSDLPTVQSLLDKSKAIGFKEVWIETANPAVLEGAVEKGKTLGIGIRLVIRPWRMTEANDMPDLNLLGDSATSLNSWIRKNDRMKPENELPGFYRSVPMQENSLSPDKLPESWSSYQDLGSTPGLDGVIVLDPQTGGYESETGESRSESPAKLLPRHFGYSTSMRIAFLRQYGADPIDLVPNAVFSAVNVSPFFFPDYALMGSSREDLSSSDEQLIKPFTGLWNTFRANSMKESLRRLNDATLSKLKGPIWADLLLNSANRPMNSMIPFIDYKTSGFQYDIGGAGTPFGAAVANPVGLRFIVEPFLPATENTEVMMKLLSQPELRAGKFSLCYDLSKFKSEEAIKFLDTWFEPQK